ncbi:MAG: four helix bundle protein [Verrucomicrobia bacterium]|nr:four helix bundle protein [Verrucomicrobiota bacterium]
MSGVEPLRYSEVLDAAASRLQEPTADGTPSPADLAERTLDFAVRIIRVFQSLPKRGEAAVLGHQLLRSGTSVGANYREARRARSNAELIAKLGDALKEAEETHYWLTLLVRAEVMPAPRLALILAETEDLCRIFTAGVKTTRRKPAAKTRPRSNP